MQKIEHGADDAAKAINFQNKKPVKANRFRYLEIHLFSEIPISRVMRMSSSCDISELGQYFGVNLSIGSKNGNEEIGIGVFGKSAAVDEFRRCILSHSNYFK